MTTPTNSFRDEAEKILNVFTEPNQGEVYLTDLLDKLTALHQEEMRRVINIIQDSYELSISDLELYEHQHGGAELPAINKSYLLQQIREASGVE